MSALPHGDLMEDMSTDLRSVVLLGPKPRPPIGGQYHPNSRQRQAAEAGARRQRVQRLLQIHESRKSVLRLERGLEASRAKLQAMEEEAGVDGVRTLAQFKSPAVPAMAAMLNRKRRLQDAMAGATSRHQGDGGEAVKRHRLEVEDDMARARRRLGDGLQDGLGVLLRHKRLSALLDEESSRQRSEVYHDDAWRRQRFAASHSHGQELPHLCAKARQSGGLSADVQDEVLRLKREVTHEDSFRQKRSDVVQDDAVRRADSLERKLQGLRRKNLHLDALEDDAMQRRRLEAQEKVDTTHRYHSVVRELKEAQERVNKAEPKIEVTAASASPLGPKKFFMDESPMMMAWYGKPGYEPTTPTDLTHSPPFVRVPKGVPGATPDPLCRSPSAHCRSPMAFCRSPSAR